MKIQLGLVGLLLALGLVKCGEPSEEMKNLSGECEKEVGVSPKGPPNFDDPKIKCFSACLLKKEGALADGKVIPEKTLEFAAKNFPGKALDSAKEAITECANKANEGKDECEVGGVFHKCMMDKHPY